MSTQRVFIAMGSSCGNRVRNLERGLEHLHRDVGKVHCVSGLYETATMPKFVNKDDLEQARKLTAVRKSDGKWLHTGRHLNACCVLDTNLRPRELVRQLKLIEKACGRSVKWDPALARFFEEDSKSCTENQRTWLETEKAEEASRAASADTKPRPRPLDLDVLFYGDQIVEEALVTIPHPRMLERNFVMAPLREVLMQTGQLDTFMHPGTRERLAAYPVLPCYPERYIVGVTPQLQATCLLQAEASSSTATLPSFGKKPYIMGILNATPDSFSDGGVHFTRNKKQKLDGQNGTFTANGNIGGESREVAGAQQMMKEGADFVDLGGESTRPGADYVCIQEELARTERTMKELKQASIPFSIDTRKPQVAAKALELGCLCVNDVSFGEFDPLTQETPPQVSQLTMFQVIANHVHRDNSRDVSEEDSEKANSFGDIDFEAEAEEACYIGMHSVGTPKTMNGLIQDEHLDEQTGRTITIAECVARYCHKRIYTDLWGTHQVAPWRVICDAGIGFGKTPVQNMDLLRDAQDLAFFDNNVASAASKTDGLTKKQITAPLCYGFSRKRSVAYAQERGDLEHYVWNKTDPQATLPGNLTLFSGLTLRNNYARQPLMLRMHDVRASVQTRNTLETAFGLC